MSASQKHMLTLWGWNQIWYGLGQWFGSCYAPVRCKCIFLISFSNHALGQNKLEYWQDGRVQNIENFFESSLCRNAWFDVPIQENNAV
jgi:hypothetical protein